MLPAAPWALLFQVFWRRRSFGSVENHGSLSYDVVYYKKQEILDVIRVYLCL